MVYSGGELWVILGGRVIILNLSEYWDNHMTIKCEILLGIIHVMGNIFHVS